MIDRTADTIFALASGSVPAAIAVIRVSGSRSPDILRALCDGPVPPARRLSLRRLHDAGGNVLDQAIVAWLPGPGTYTGEDCAELSLHGGRAVIDAVTRTLAALGLRPADPGEFTRRAFLSGRMDLTEAEGVHDLIAAETEAQRRQALRQLNGDLGATYRAWSDRIRLMLAQQEAVIDFPDEDLPKDIEDRLLADLAALCSAIVAHLDDGHRGEKLREGLFFAITGAPNVGKSSLINALACRDVAIVSPTPGTTRDVLEARVVFGDVPVTLVDTAGLRETRDSIEAEGVRRALLRVAEADLVIVVIEAGDGMPDVGGGLVVANKADLASRATKGAIAVSALTGQGLDELRARLADAARRLTETTGPPPLTRIRHRQALVDALTYLRSAATADLAELRGEDLRQATRAIGRITGQVGVEEILDALFSSFCIGK